MKRPKRDLSGFRGMTDMKALANLLDQRLLHSVLTMIGFKDIFTLRVCFGNRIEIPWNLVGPSMVVIIKRIQPYVELADHLAEQLRDAYTVEDVVDARKEGRSFMRMNPSFESDEDDDDDDENEAGDAGFGDDDDDDEESEGDEAGALVHPTPLLVLRPPEPTDVPGHKDQDDDDEYEDGTGYASAKAQDRIRNEYLHTMEIYEKKEGRMDDMHVLLLGHEVLRKIALSMRTNNRYDRSDPSTSRTIDDEDDDVINEEEENDKWIQDSIHWVCRAPRCRGLAVHWCQNHKELDLVGKCIRRMCARHTGCGNELQCKGCHPHSSQSPFAPLSSSSSSSASSSSVSPSLSSLSSLAV